MASLESKNSKNYNRYKLNQKGLEAKKLQNAQTLLKKGNVKPL